MLSTFIEPYTVTIAQLFFSNSYSLNCGSDVAIWDATRQWRYFTDLRFSSEWNAHESYQLNYWILSLHVIKIFLWWGTVNLASANYCYNWKCPREFTQEIEGSLKRCLWILAHLLAYQISVFVNRFKGTHQRARPAWPTKSQHIFRHTLNLVATTDVHLKNVLPN